MRSAATLVVAAIVSLTGIALAWRGFSIWSGAGNARQQNVAAERELKRLSAASYDIALSGSSAESVEEAAVKLKPSLDTALAAAAEELGPEVWRPRLAPIARSVTERMKAVWRLDSQALETIALEEGAVEFPDWSDLSEKKRRAMANLAELWKQHWTNVSVSSDIRVRTSAFERWFSNPLPKPRRVSRNPRKAPVPDLPPQTLLLEVLVPAKIGPTSQRQTARTALLGFSYYWSENERRWKTLTTTVYEHGEGEYIGAPP